MFNLRREIYSASYFNNSHAFKPQQIRVALHLRHLQIPMFRTQEISRSFLRCKLKRIFHFFFNIIVNRVN